MATLRFNLTAITPQGQWRSFSFQHPDLEIAYSLLQNIVQQGDTLLDVRLLDEHGDLLLPVDDFEKPYFVNPIELFRQQWETLLA